MVAFLIYRNYRVMVIIDNPYFYGNYLFPATIAKLDVVYYITVFCVKSYMHTLTLPTYNIESSENNIENILRQ